MVLRDFLPRKPDWRLQVYHHLVPCAEPIQGFFSPSVAPRFRFPDGEIMQKSYDQIKHSPTAISSGSTSSQGAAFSVDSSRYSGSSSGIENTSRLVLF